MIIAHNLNALRAYRQMKINNVNIGKCIQNLSSGYKINRAGDDAAGLAISEKMRSQIRGLTQASRNAQDGISMIQTAEGVLTETHAMLQRLKTLAVQAANDTLGDSDRALIQKEVVELQSEITRIADQTEFNGIKVCGLTTSKSFQVGNKSGQEISATFGKMDASTIGVGKMTADRSKGINLSTKENAKASLAHIESAIKTVSEQRATFGAVQNRLEHTISSLDNTVENLEAAESRIRDADMADEMMNYMKYNILSNAAQAMLAQAIQSPNNILSLLQ